jgi:hypothetical protein
MVDATKIAKLRAKALSTGYPEEAEALRKASDLMKQHAISEAAVQHELDAIFGGRADSLSASSPGPGRPAKRGSIEAAIWMFEEEDNRAMRAREIWTLIETRGLYTSVGRTPWATVASTDPIFERVAPGLYRVRR